MTFIAGRSGVQSGEVIAMLEYPAPTRLWYVLSALSLVGTALILFGLFAEPWPGPVRFWGQIASALGSCLWVVSRILPSPLRSVGALLAMPLVVVGICLLVATHVG
jgi:hypothetical protein